MSEDNLVQTDVSQADVPSGHQPSEFVKRIAASIASMVIEWVDGGRTPDEDWRPGLEAIIAGRLNRFLAQRQSEEPGTGDTSKDDASLTSKTGHQDFEAKAREVAHGLTTCWSEQPLALTVDWHSEQCNELTESIVSALSEAYEAGRDLVQTQAEPATAPSGHQDAEFDEDAPLWPLPEGEVVAECLPPGEIAALRSRIAELEAALKPFAEAEAHEDMDFGGNTPLFGILSGDRVKLIDLRLARATLGSQVTRTEIPRGV